MRLDHLLSMENRGLQRVSENKLQVQLQECERKQALVIALFNFEDAVRGRLKKERPKANLYGGVAQLGEHLLCKQGVRGSIPLISIGMGP